MVAIVVAVRAGLIGADADVDGGVGTVGLTGRRTGNASVIGSGGGAGGTGREV